jgi:hypothetical protein
MNELVPVLESASPETRDLIRLRAVEDELDIENYVRVDG